MNAPGHIYRRGVRGRSITTAPGVINAHLQCQVPGCNRTGRIGLRAVMPPEHIDRKFEQLGWRLDPHVCPACVAIQKKEKKMAEAAKPSPVTMKAQAAMFRLLDQHFDAEVGRFDEGWSDDRIAKETGLKKEAVAEFRRAGFGEIREDPAVASIRADIASLAKLAEEQNGALAQGIAEIRARLAKLTEGTAR